MAKTPQLIEFVQGSIRAEKARLNWTYADLSAALRSHGIEQSATNLSTKVGRGNMSAPLFIAVLKVLGKRTIDLSDLALPEVKKSSRKASGR